MLGIPPPPLALDLPLQGSFGNGLGVVSLGRDAPRAPMRPHAFMSKTPPNRSGCSTSR